MISSKVASIPGWKRQLFHAATVPRCLRGGVHAVAVPTDQEWVSAFW